MGWRMKTLPPGFQVNAGTILPDCHIVIADDDRLFISRDSGESFSPLASFSGSHAARICRMHSTSDGVIFYSSRRTNTLLRSADGGKTFEAVIEDMNGPFRGFVELPGGGYFCGLYSEDGPAVLLSSPDGIRWEEAHSWNARHVHDVRMNPHNGWLYVIVGEGDPKPTGDSHSVYRSTDKGGTFAKIHSADERRPLFTAINFRDELVLLGTDHPEGRNSVFTFVDTGDDAIQELEIAFTLPDDVGEVKVSPFFHFLEWVGETLFAGTKGSGTCALLKTDDLSNWEIVYATCAKDAIPWSCVSASRGSSDALVVTGRPGLLIEADPGAETPGLPVQNASKTAVRAAVSAARPAGQARSLAKRFAGLLGGAKAPRTMLESERAAGHSQEPPGRETLRLRSQTWGTDIEQEIRTVLNETDPRYEEEFSKGYFYRANPFFYNKIQMRETLVQLMHRGISKEARILDYGCGTGQFLLYLAKFGFGNLHGWDQNDRWLRAAERLFRELGSPDCVTFKKVDRPSIYNLLDANGGQPFDVITMFGLIYGHDIDVDRIFESAENALQKGGMFVVNDNVHPKNKIMSLGRSAGLRLYRRICVYTGKKEENNIYFFSV